PDRGKVTAFMTIRASDATVFDNGQGNDSATVVARGLEGRPGEFDWRPGPDKPVERTARWSDTLTFEVDPARAAASGQGPRPKRITLPGRPSFPDAPSQSPLASRKVLVVYLLPKPKPAAAAPPATGPTPASRSRSRSSSRSTTST